MTEMPTADAYCIPFLVRLVARFRASLLSSVLQQPTNVINTVILNVASQCFLAGPQHFYSPGIFGMVRPPICILCTTVGNGYCDNKHVLTVLVSNNL